MSILYLRHPDMPIIAHDSGDGSHEQFSLPANAEAVATPAKALPTAIEIGRSPLVTFPFSW